GVGAERHADLLRPEVRDHDEGCILLRLRGPSGWVTMVAGRLAKRRPGTAPQVRPIAGVRAEYTAAHALRHRPTVTRGSRGREWPRPGQRGVRACGPRVTRVPG